MLMAAKQRWSAEKANTWWDARDWVCGVNFLPSTSVNFLEMWMGESFDRETIARELGWASKIGFNAVRTNPHYLVWKNDRDGLLERMEWFLAEASKLGIDTMFVPLDDCGFGGLEPEYGPQFPPVPNVHNSRAVASPGREAVPNQNYWKDFEAYIKDIIGTFRNDDRVLMWDLYNEPGNLMIFTESGYTEHDQALKKHSRDLMLASFEWAREVEPTQPLTVGAWHTAPTSSDEKPFGNEIDNLALDLSDVITFHAYCDREHAEKIIKHLSKFRRPILSTEWMARSIDSTISDQLELYHDRKVGCFNWGFVQGKSQTHLPWPQVLEDLRGQVSGEPGWFHDILWPDGTPYDENEVKLIAKLTSSEMN